MFTGPLLVEAPEWVRAVAASAVTAHPTDEDKMRLAILLSAENVRRGAGGPFGAAVYRLPDHALVAVGVNSVERLRNSALHAEVMALMLAEASEGSFSLRHDVGETHELFTSCDPCAMCLGASLWSGVSRIVCAADRADAAAIGFDEGPVFEESWRYLEARGIGVVRGLLRGEARAVLEEYHRRRGAIYNP